MNPTRLLTVAVVAGAALVAVATPAYAVGSPSSNSSSHLNIQIPVDCAGEQLLVVAGDNGHAAAQIVSGGTGHLIPVSMTFIAPDGSVFVDQLAAHPQQDTVTCSGTDMSGQGGSVTIVAIRMP
ncbi:hypothetical protein [Microbacterium panaciterrae]|uniref:Uncharacterized protein n=1 Tax=Microbacterium panaciterrae TaxID=985759 RepID=A0ABP8PDU9_9MICO